MNFLKAPAYSCCRPLFKKQQWWSFLLFICGWLLCSARLSYAQEGRVRLLQSPFGLVRDSAWVVDHLNQVAISYQLKQLDSCYRYADSALEMATRQQYTAGKAATYKILGNYYAFTSNKYLAYRFCRDARILYEAMGDTAHLVPVVMNQAVYYEQDSAHDRAVTAFRTAMALGATLKKDSVYGQVLANYDFIYRNDSTKRDSIKWAVTKAHEIARRYDDKRLLFYLAIREADHLLPTAGMAVVSRRLDSLYQEADRLRYYYLAFRASRLMMEYKSRLKAPDSIRYYEQMVTAAGKGGYNGLIMDAADKLYHYYHERHNEAAATRYGGIMLTSLRYIENIKAQGEVDYMGYFMQDQQMRQLQADFESQRQVLEGKRIERRNMIFGIVVGAIILGGIIWGIAYVVRASRRTRKHVREQEAINKEIREKNALLKTNDDFKNMMISLIAHDFRLPLANVLDVTTLLKRRTFTLEEAAALIIKAETAASNTLVVFDNILRWIRTQLSGFVYAPEPCDPTALILAAWKGLEPLAAEKRIHLVVNVPSTLRVYGHPEMLQFVHRNLLHNALKFSPGGTDITVSAKRTDGFVTITFSDQGTGMPAEVLTRLFAFNVHGAGGVQQAKGAGLALIICKDFINKMNGNIQAGNNAGGGSSFWYTLPDLVKN